jgi:hypothetical protein
MTRELKALLFGFVGLAIATAVAAQESLTTAKDLYASAAYEDALSTLTRLHDSNVNAAPVAAQIDQYRAFCLFALGRTAEAESVAESLVKKDPLLQLDAGDASPRIVAMFADVRKRLLPTLTRDQYRAARASLDRRDFLSAESQLTRTRQLLEETEQLGASDETLGDLRVLVDGFLVLTRSATEGRATDPFSRPPAAASAAAASSPAAPGGTAPSPSPAALAAAAPSTATLTATGPSTATLTAVQSPNGLSPAVPTSRAPASQPRQPLQIYDFSAADVVPPVVIRQQMPSIPPGLANLLSTIHRSGVLDVTIDQQGNVEQAVMREGVHPIFDTLILDAARSWKYGPAMKDGVAVRYLRTIAIVKQ